MKHNAARTASDKAATPRRCLVLGGCGFIGSHIVDALVAGGNEVAVFDKENVDSANIRHHGEKVSLILGDFTNASDLEHALIGVDALFHFVGTTMPKTSTENPVYDAESNIVATIRLLEAARAAGVRKVVFASSGGTVYGIPERLPISEEHPTRPVCAYGVSKLAVEKYLHLYHYLHGLDYTVLRIANAYGERQRLHGAQGLIPAFVQKIMGGEPIEIFGDGSVVRDYVHSEDIARACLLALSESGDAPRVINIGSGVGTSILDMVEIFRKASGREVVVKHLPSRRIDVPANILDCSLAKKVLGWSPRVSLEQGVCRLFKETGRSGRGGKQ